MAVLFTDIAEAVMAADPETSEEAIRRAEAYFDHVQIKKLLVQMLAHLAKLQPEDPVTCLRQFLDIELQRPLQPAPGSEVPVALEPAAAEPEEERDTNAPAEVDALRLLVYFRPNKDAEHDEDLSQRLCWAGGFNRLLLHGWVAQPSPCCAAASVAGAFNALWAKDRGSDGRASVQEVAELMAQHCDELRVKKQERLERLLGARPGALDELLEAVDDCVHTQGLEWTAGKGPKAVTKKVAMDAVREVLHGIPTPDVPLSEAGEGEPPAAAFAEALPALRQALGEDFFAAARPDGEAEEEDAKAENRAEPEAEAKASAAVLVCDVLDWKRELQEFLTKRKGVLRLRAQKPNTGEVGSWGVKQAAEALVTVRGAEALSVRTLIGRRTGAKASAVQHQITKGDDMAAIDSQWGALKAAFGKANSVLLFHLTNHYALIFAWREWLPSEVSLPCSQLRRQVLTARKGQRPTAWMDFDEVRNIVLGWSGYNILHIERQVSRDDL